MSEATGVVCTVYQVNEERTRENERIRIHQSAHSEEQTEYVPIPYSHLPIFLTATLPNLLNGVQASCTDIETRRLQNTILLPSSCPGRYHIVEPTAPHLHGALVIASQRNEKFTAYVPSHRTELIQIFFHSRKPDGMWW